jgi:hypothetical protein
LIDKEQLDLICDGLLWDKVTEEECGILIDGIDEAAILKIYRDKRDWSEDRLMFQLRRKLQREEVMKNDDKEKAGIGKL